MLHSCSQAEPSSEFGVGSDPFPLGIDAPADGYSGTTATAHGMTYYVDRMLPFPQELVITVTGVGAASVTVAENGTVRREAVSDTWSYTVPSPTDLVGVRLTPVDGDVSAWTCTIREDGVLVATQTSPDSWGCTYDPSIQAIPATP